MITDFTAVDLETTGLNPKTDRIIEIGAVRVRDKKVTACFNSLIHPHRKLEEKVTVLTGITDEELQKAPEEAEVLGKLLAFLGDDILLGHRILFDYSFLKRAVINGRLGQKQAGAAVFEKQGIDTLKIARQFLPNLESRRLSFLCEYYQIPHKAHRAENDARAAALLYLKMAEEFYEEKAFAPVPLVYKVKRESPITEKQKERLYKLAEKHKLVLDMEIDRLTRNEASRFADKIISKYGK